MKKVLLVLLLATGAMTLHAQDGAANTQQVDKDAPVFKFVNGETHDFGNMKEGDTAVYEFRFKNVGKKPLVFTKVKASCSCTVPEWPKEPILPGKSNTLKVSFNTTGKSGPFTKTVYIYSNARSEKDAYEVYIKGSVTPKAGSAAPVKE